MTTFDEVWSLLRRGEHGGAFMLIDCAGVDGGRARLPTAAFAELESLFTGDLAMELADVGPWLGRLAPAAPGASAAVLDLLQRQVGVLVVMATPEGGASGPSFSQVHRHFRKFNIVYGADGRPLFFRYCDPRVVLDVLKVFTARQLEEFFGGADELVLTRADGQIVRCRRQAGTLLVADGATASAG